MLKVAERSKTGRTDDDVAAMVAPVVHQYRAYQFEPFEIAFRIPGESIPYTWRLQQARIAPRYYNRRRRDRRFLEEPLSSSRIQTPEPGSHLEAPKSGSANDEYLCFENFRIKGTDHVNPIKLFYKMVEDHKFELHSCTISSRALLQLIAFKAARRYSGRPKGVDEQVVSEFDKLSLDND